MSNAKKLFLLISIFFNFSHAEVKNLSKPSTDANVIIPVSQNDIKILHRASQILSDKTKWNRKDTRECPKNAKTFSLYCALYLASEEINGVFDHRLAALEETRRTVEEFSKGKTYQHRLMDYNNDVSTSFKDIKNILSTTETRLVARMKRNI